MLSFIRSLFSIFFYRDKVKADHFTPMLGLAFSFNHTQLVFYALISRTELFRNLNEETGGHFYPHLKSGRFSSSFQRCFNLAF